MKLARLAAGAALVVLSACSGGTASIDELPGPVPENVVFRDPPAGAPPAPAFELDLLGGDALDLTEQWDARPVVLVFFESWCTLCHDQQESINDVVDDYRDVVLFVGIANLSEPADVEQYVGDNDITYPVGIDSTGRTFLNYAVTEPPLVALVSKGGQLLRGWPEGISGEELRKHIDELAVESH
ncbi:MAG TPA: TlpA disulfide reductase family protein [Jiangellaceae bacterium]